MLWDQTTLYVFAHVTLGDGAAATADPSHQTGGGDPWDTASFEVFTNVNNASGVGCYQWRIDCTGFPSEGSSTGDGGAGWAQSYGTDGDSPITIPFQYAAVMTATGYDVEFGIPLCPPGTTTPATVTPDSTQIGIQMQINDVDSTSTRFGVMGLKQGLDNSWNSQDYDFITLGSTVITPNVNIGSVPMASGITVDGQMDPAYNQGLQVQIAYPCQAGVADDAPTSTGTAYMLWDQTTLYVFAHVTLGDGAAATADPTHQTGGGDPWDTASFEVFTNVNNAGGVGCYQWRIDCTGFPSEGSSTGDGGAGWAQSYGTDGDTPITIPFQYAAVMTSTGYDVEFGIPLCPPGTTTPATVTPDSTQIGVQMQINDVDSTSARIGVMGLKQGLDNSWNSQNFDYVTLASTDVTTTATPAPTATPTTAPTAAPTPAPSTSSGGSLTWLWIVIAVVVVAVVVIIIVTTTSKKKKK